jgi:SAM-dependent methyltransferase
MNGKPLHCLLVALTVAVAAPSWAQEVKKDVPYVPTPEDVVEKMLDMADVKEGDVVYDLGCGDGRIVIAAAKRGATGIGVDIDPQRIEESNANAKAAGVTDKVKFEIKNLFDMEFGDANVLAMYLLPSVNLQLRPKILNDMKPGSRVVSHAFDMGDWEADEEANVDYRTVYYWTVPAKVGGTWDVKIQTDQGEQQAQLDLRQEFQMVSGTARIGDREVELQDVKLKGDKLTFSLNGAGNVPAQQIVARIDGEKMQSAAKGENQEQAPVQISGTLESTDEAHLVGWEQQPRQEREEVTN